MVVIQLSNVKLVLGARVLFENFTWEIQHSQKIGLIGANGAGKSSLLKLITGEYQSEPGSGIVRLRGVTVGYLSQQVELGLDQTAWQAALDGNLRVAEIEAELHRVELSFSDPKVYNHPRSLEQALHIQEQLLEEYKSLGGENYPQYVRDLLLGLGLPELDLDKPLRVLSGGQKKLVGLARLLLSKPSVLLLDEPDNHLDLPGKRFLERLIQEYPGAVVIVSHDRYLLDSVVTHIVEIEDGRPITFEGDYSAYILDKQVHLARQEELFRVQQRAIGRLQAAIKRYAIWGKVFDNEKFAARAKAMQKRLDKMDKIERPITDRRRMDLQLSGWRGSNKVLELKGVAKSYGKRQLFVDLDQVLWHGERVGLIGANGAGKSVLLRMVLGKEHPDCGEIMMGPSVQAGYYAQEHETLDLNQTLIDAVRYAGSLSEASAVAFLIRYLFSYRQATQLIGDLSGGERSRLQLALLVLSGANFLLLDEPTNNLDIASAEVLEDALSEFVGTVLVISHDRYFLDQVVDRILVIENGKVMNYPGVYSDYLSAQKK